jgi:3-hydroxyisobutyrate dehydrogenase-like beta-hydroxyacid dehydrogenase
MRAGFIGLGNLGEPMAAQVAKAGLDLTVFDLRPDPVGRLAALGARSAESVDALAGRCDVILLAVVDDRQVRDVLLGTDDGSAGVLASADPGTVVVVHSTVHPETCRQLCATAREHQIEVLDAPVTGGPAGARTGSLSVMVGGSESALNRCRPVLSAMADHITHLGESGAGQLAKIANNVGLAITMRAVHEALAFAEANGIDAARMLELLGWGAANSWVVQNWPAIGDSVASYHTDGALGLAKLTYKDLALALSIAHTHELSLPATALTAQLLVEPYLSAQGFVETSSAPPTSNVEEARP